MYETNRCQKRFGRIHEIKCVWNVIVLFHISYKVLLSHLGVHGSHGTAALGWLYSRRIEEVRRKKIETAERTVEMLERESWAGKAIATSESGPARLIQERLEYLPSEKSWRR